MAAQHRGEIIKEIIQQNGVNQTRLAKDLRMSRSSLYRQYDIPNLSFVFIRQVGAAIGYDFSARIKGLVTDPSMVAEPAAAYPLDSLADCQQRLLRVHEQFMEKVRQYDELKARYEDLLTSRP